MVDRIRPIEEPTVIEPSRVRGRPFKHGNPGRPPGSKNKTTRLIEELFDGEAEKLTRKLVDRALGGDTRCLLYCVDRASPKGRGRPLGLQMRTINSVCDVPPAMSEIAQAMTNGDLTVEEGSRLVQILDSYSNAVVASEFAVRLQNLEERVKMLNTLKRRRA